MTLNHLRIFVEVVKCGKMNLAAEHLYISQPTVSQAISDLEHYYNVRLFERYPRRLCITYYGNILYQHAKEVLETYERLESTMKGLLQSAPIRVGSTVTIGATIINDLVAQFKEIRPASIVKLIINNTRTIETMLVNNELDIALVEGVIQRHDMIVEPVIADYLVMVCGKSHPFFQHSDLLARDLEGQPFIMWDKGSGTRLMVDNFIQNQQLRVDVKLECTNFDTIKQFVRNGTGISVMSIRLAEKEIQMGDFRVLHVKDWIGARNFSLAYLKNKYLTDDVNTFISLCREYKANDLSLLLRESF